MQGRSENVSQHVLSKPIPCQRGHKMYLNLCGQTPPMPARTQNVSQTVLRKRLSFQQERKRRLNFCWQNTTHVSDDRKCISTCKKQTPPIYAWVKHAYGHVLTEHIPC